MCICSDEAMEPLNNAIKSNKCRVIVDKSGFLCFFVAMGDLKMDSDLDSNKDIVAMNKFSSQVTFKEDTTYMQKWN